MASTRLPGKPLADIAGLPMIVHVLRRAEAAHVGEAVVATDSEAVMAAVEKSGGRALMTRSDHVSGSDRIYEALEALDPEHRIEVVVNVQGDLPTIDPADIRAALKPLADPKVDIATLATEIKDPSDLTNPNVVKVKGAPVATGRLHAATFTRADAQGPGPCAFARVNVDACRRPDATGAPFTFTTFGLVSSAASLISAASVAMSTFGSVSGLSAARISAGSMVGRSPCTLTTTPRRRSGSSACSAS